MPVITIIIIVYRSSRLRYIQRDHTVMLDLQAQVGICKGENRIMVLLVQLHNVIKRWLIDVFLRHARAAMRTYVFIEPVAFDKKGIIGYRYPYANNHQRCLKNHFKPAEQINDPRNDQEADDPEMSALIG